MTCRKGAGRWGGEGTGGGAGARSKVFTSTLLCIFCKPMTPAHRALRLVSYGKSQLRDVLSMMTAMAKGGATHHSLLQKLPIFIRKQRRSYIFMRGKKMPVCLLCRGCSAAVIGSRVGTVALGLHCFQTRVSISRPQTPAQYRLFNHNTQLYDYGRERKALIRL